jgi:hypothetical protein
MNDSGMDNLLGSPWHCRAPLLAAAALICLVNGYNLNRLVRADSPRNPWEATEVVEAWRSLRGMPIYELSPHGHSTHMYGALVPWVQGTIFRWVGPNNISGRVLTLVSALVTVTLLAVFMRGHRSAWYFVVAWAVILGVNHRSLGYFAENRPDMTALMFATLAVLLMGYGQENRRGRFVVLGSACLVVGFFFKQSAAAFAAVPLVALIMRREIPGRSEVLLASFPLVVSGGVILCLKVFSPAIYFYMIEVPGAYPLNWPKVARVAWELLLDSPLFLVLVGERIVFDRRRLRDDPRLLWLAAVLAVTIPSGAIMTAKAGGTPNSLLPALLPMMAFCVLRLPRILMRVKNKIDHISSQLIASGFVALLVLMTAFPHLTREHGLIVPASLRDRAYWEAVSLVRTLPGTVVCPEDPTIPAYAKSYVGRNIFSEYDAHVVNRGWPVTPPEAVASEIRAANYVVDVSNYFQDIVDDEFLEDFGFVPLRGTSLDPACYRIWRRNSVETASRTGRIRGMGESARGRTDRQMMGRSQSTPN